MGSPTIPVPGRSHRRAMRAAGIALSVAALAGCSTSPHSERARLIAPQSVSAVYSEIDMRMNLVSAGDARACADPECALGAQFDLMVARQGGRLAEAAFTQYPETADRVTRFEFVIADKEEIGTTSNSGGVVAILRGTQSLGLSEDALGFVIAREMGHVIAGHHEENTATRVIFSAIAQLLLPVANLLRSLDLFAGASTALNTGAASGAASVGTAALKASAASMIGSRIVIASYRPEQRAEADTVALNLVRQFGADAGRIAADLSAAGRAAAPSRWAGELLASAEFLRSRSESASAPAAETLASRAEPRTIR